MSSADPKASSLQDDARAAAAEPFTPKLHAPPVPAMIQQMWWNWVQGWPVQLPHERLQLSLRLEGVDPSSAERALRALIARHHTLRSRFARTERGLEVVLNPPEGFTVEITRIPTDSESAFESERLSFVSGEMRVDGEWLSRARIVVGPSAVLICVMCHHMVFDARSGLLLQRELRERLAPGADPDAAFKPAQQYLDYAAWERTWLARSGQALAAYWRDWLADAPALRNPGAQEDLTWRPGHKAYHHFEIGGAAVARMRALAEAEDSAPFKVLMAATALAVGRWTGQGRFVLRVIGDLRSSRRLPNMVGNLVCTDLVDVRIPAGQNFPALLEQVSREHKSAMQRRCPNLLGLPGSAAYPDVSEGGIGAKTAVTFNYMPVAKALTEEPDDTPLPPPVAARSQQREFWPVPVCPINLRVWDWGNRLICRLEFDDDAVAETQQRRLAELFIDTIYTLSPQASR